MHYLHMERLKYNLVQKWRVKITLNMAEIRYLSKKQISRKAYSGSFMHPLRTTNIENLQNHRTKNTEWKSLFSSVVNAENLEIDVNLRNWFKREYTSKRQKEIQKNLGDIRRMTLLRKWLPRGRKTKKVLGETE